MRTLPRFAMTCNCRGSLEILVRGSVLQRFDFSFMEGPREQNTKTICAKSESKGTTRSLFSEDTWYAAALPANLQFCYIRYFIPTD